MAAACDGALPARQVSPTRFHGKPVRMCPRSHSAAAEHAGEHQRLHALRGRSAR